MFIDQPEEMRYTRSCDSCGISDVLYLTDEEIAAEPEKWLCDECTPPVD